MIDENQGIHENEEICDIQSNKRKRKRESKEEIFDLNNLCEENEEKSSIISEDLSESVANDDKSSIHSELSNTMTIEDKNNEKLYRNYFVQTRIPAVSMYSKNKLLRVCCNAFAYHRLNSAAKLMSALISDKRTPHSFIVKAGFTLFTQNTSDSSLLVKSMKKLSKLDVNKREIMLEMILYFLAINDKTGAKKYIDSNESYLKLPIFRKNRLIDTYLNCYVCFVDYLEWKQSKEESNHNFFFHSNRVIAQKTKLSLKNLINETKELVLDYFVLILIEMYEDSLEFSEAHEILEVYIGNNQEHLNSYIYLYNFCVKYPEYSKSDSQSKALQQIQKYSPENQLILNLIQTKDQIVDKFEVLMEFVDYKQNFDNINAWTQLKELLISIDDKTIKKLIKKLWKDVYQEYWVRLHCNLTKIKELNENIIKLIRCKQKVIEFFYSSSHSYIIQSNPRIDEYQSRLNFD